MEQWWTMANWPSHAPWSSWAALPLVMDFPSNLTQEVLKLTTLSDLIKLLVLNLLVTAGTRKRIMSDHIRSCQIVIHTKSCFKFIVLVCTGSYLKVLSGELSFPDGWNLFLIPTMIEANHWVQMHLLVAKAPVPKESAQVFSRVWTTPTFYRTGSRWSAGTGYDTINCPVIRHGKGQQRTNPFFPLWTSPS